MWFRDKGIIRNMKVNPSAILLKDYDKLKTKNSMSQTLFGTKIKQSERSIKSLVPLTQRDNDRFLPRLEKDLDWTQENKSTHSFT